MAILKKKGQAALTRRQQRRARPARGRLRRFRLGQGNLHGEPAERDAPGVYLHGLKGQVGQIDPDYDYERIEASRHAMSWNRRRANGAKARPRGRRGR